MKSRILFTLSCGALCIAWYVARAESAPARHVEDVIYGRKDGLALTMDVFMPEKGNGAAVVFVVSAGFRSSHAAIDSSYYKLLVRRGYTVFAVVHNSQPKYTIPELLHDIHRSIRFVRTNASHYQINPNRIGIMGLSAGGHLSLLMATTGCDGDPNARDPIDRNSSRVQAAACFFPLTDFLNYGETNKVVLGGGALAGFRAAFDFLRFDLKTGSYKLIVDEKVRRMIGKEISPAHQVTKESAPTLIIHGDADKIVPIQQSQLFAARMNEAGVPLEMIVRKGAGHGWKRLQRDLPRLVDWFDKHLICDENLPVQPPVSVLIFPAVIVLLLWTGRKPALQVLKRLITW